MTGRGNHHYLFNLAQTLVTWHNQGQLQIKIITPDRDFKVRVYSSLGPKYKVANLMPSRAHQEL